MFGYKININIPLEYMCQLLADTNMPLLILKMFNAWFPPIKEQASIIPNAWLNHTDPDSLYLHKRVNKPCNRNVETSNKLLQVLYKMTKNSPNRIQLLLQWKSTFVLKRVINTEVVIKAPLKLLKIQIPYFGKKWKTSANMKIISLIYHHLRPKMVESYLCDEMHDCMVRFY
jgi:hypothetical protein